MKKIAIIGGGVAGICAGIYLQRSGFECHIFEKNNFPGGNLTGWDRNSYHIDNCIHWLTGTNKHTKMNRIWHETGALDNTKIIQPKYFYVSELADKRIHMYKSSERTRKEMTDLSPVDKKEIDKFINAVNLCARYSLKSKFSYISMPKMLLKYYHLSLNDLSRQFTHPLLKRVFTDYIGGSFSSLGLIFAYSAFISGNGGIPLGGSAAMAKRMKERFEALGGTFHLSSEVTRVITKNGSATGVIINDKSFFHADTLVFSCDTAITFSKLLKGYLPNDLAEKYTNEKMPVFSSIQCAFACDTDKLPFKDNFIFESEALCEDDEKRGRIVVREYSDQKSFAPEGKNIIQCLIFQKKTSCMNWIALRKYNMPKYKSEKERLAKELEKRIVKRFPELDGKLTLLDFWTPASYRRYFGSPYGSYMSFALCAGVFPKKSSCKVKGLRNVYLASQWLQAPGGLPIAAKSGKSTAEKIIKREKGKISPLESLDLKITKA